MRATPSSSTNPGPSSVEVSFTFRTANGRNRNHGGKDRAVEPGNAPRVSRIMALAIRFDDLVRRGEVSDHADLARLGYVTQARISQIMCLLHFAPDIQEALLFLPRTLQGRDPIREKDLRPIATVRHWSRQRKMWARLVAGRVKVVTPVPVRRHSIRSGPDSDAILVDGAPYAEIGAGA